MRIPLKLAKTTLQVQNVEPRVDGLLCFAHCESQTIQALYKMDFYVTLQVSSLGRRHVMVSSLLSQLLTHTDTPSVSDHAYQAFPRTRRITVHASGE